jgi:hypothetical protein
MLDIVAAIYATAYFAAQMGLLIGFSPVRRVAKLVALHSDSDGLGPTVRLAPAGVSDQRGPRCCEGSWAAF